MKSINEMLIHLKNVQHAGHPLTQMSYSKFRHEVAKALQRAGYVSGVDRSGKRVKKVLELKMNKTVPGKGVHNVRHISTGGRRLYLSYKDLRPARRGGVVLLSTSKGVLSGEEARKAKAGGELIAEIW